MLLELYSVFYIDKDPVMVKGHKVLANTSYARDLLHWSHRHVLANEETLLKPDWANVCRCLVQGACCLLHPDLLLTCLVSGYFSAALNMMETQELSEDNPELIQKIRQQIEELTSQNMSIYFDRYPKTY